MEAFLNIDTVGASVFPSLNTVAVRKTGNRYLAPRQEGGMEPAPPALNGPRTTGKGKEAAHPAEGW